MKVYNFAEEFQFTFIYFDKNSQKSVHIYLLSGIMAAMLTLSEIRESVLALSTVSRR
jgi:hypothetical protein